MAPRTAPPHTMTELNLPGARPGTSALQISTPGLGDHSYVLSDGSQAAVIDPQRDLDRFEAALESLGVPLTLVLETHVHNDYVSGGRALAQRHGAMHVLPADGGYQFDHHPVADGDEVKLGQLLIRALHTPGHTPHHTSFAAFEDDELAVVFSGGCVLVSACGRTDLLGEELTEGLTRHQYRSAHRLLALPDSTAIGPTHGAGSFCAASAASADTYTRVELEKTRNPAALAEDEDDFVNTQLAGLLAYPAYYAKMASFNVAGAPAWEPQQPPALSVEEMLRRGGTVVVDGRSRHDFAHGHIEGSINVELDDSFSTYLGWLFPFGTRFVLVLPEGTDPMEPVRQCARIGIDSIDGHLEGGIEAWTDAGRSLRCYDVTDVDGLRDALEGDVRVLDVRQDLEWADGRVPGATHIHIPEVRDRLHELTTESTPVYVICRSGHRASMAASMLDAAGVPSVLVDGGFPDWSERGNPVEK